MINPAAIMKLMSAKNTFTNNHPRVVAFFKALFSGKGITEGTIIEIKVTRPGEEPMETNMRVTEDDIRLYEELKELAKQNH